MPNLLSCNYSCKKNTTWPNTTRHYLLRTKIQQYLETLLDSSELQDSVRVSDNDMLNSILCHYTKICHDKGIKFKTDIRANLLKKLVKMYYDSRSAAFHTIMILNDV